MKIKQIQGLWDATKSQPAATRHRFRKRFFVDCYFEKPASFFSICRNDTNIRGVTSLLVVFNVGALHLSLETLGRRRDLKGEKAHEVFDETASGDG